MPKRGEGPLNERKQKFCREYIKDFNATKAAERAGYKGKQVRKTGSELLGDPRIQEKISKLAAKQVQKSDDETDLLYERLRGRMSVTMKDICDWNESGLRVKSSDDIPPIVAFYITSIKETVGQHGHTIDVKLDPPTKYLELYGKLADVGAFKDVVDHNHNMTLEDLVEKSRQEE